MIDVHAHLQKKYLRGASQEEVIASLYEKRICAIVVGVDEETSREAVFLAKKHPHLFAAIGIHPLSKKGTIHSLKNLFHHKKVVSIGECGLDYTRTDSLTETKKIQKERLYEHIQVSIKLGLPCMLHIRTAPGEEEGEKDAHRDCEAILNEVHKTYGERFCPHIHFFTDRRMVSPYMKVGASVSFSGVITFVDEYEKTVLDTPLERILSETDSPYATPAPNRGKKNTPLYIPYIVEKIADIKKIPTEKVNVQILKNAKRFFGIKINNDDTAFSPRSIR